jgi:hypothetical protein
MTFLSWTDRSAGTIVRVHTKDGEATMFDCREDKAIRTDSNGMSECQSYRFEPDHAAPVKRYKRDRKGRWRHVMLNQNMVWAFVEPKQCVRLGERDYYHDFSF